MLIVYHNVLMISSQNMTTKIVPQRNIIDTYAFLSHHITNNKILKAQHKKKEIYTPSHSEQKY